MDVDSPLMRIQQENKKIVTTDWLEDSIASGTQQPFTDKYMVQTPSLLDQLSLDGDQGRLRSESPALSDITTSVASDITSTSPQKDGTAEDIEEDRSPVYPTERAATWANKRVTPPKWQNRRFA